MWQTFLAILYKELLLLKRNTGFIRAVLLLQMVDLGIMGWLDLTVRNMPLVIVDQDHTAESRELISRVTATGTFEVAYLTTSKEQARSHIRAGRAKAAIVIPPDYGRQRAAGLNAQVLALVDGSDSTSSGQASAAIEGVAAKLNVESAKENVGGVEARYSMMFNPQGSASLFVLPGLLAIILSESFIGRAFGVATERDEGNLERLLMTPMNYTGFMLGKLAPHFLVVVANGILYILVIRWVFDVPIRGSVLLLIGALMLYSLTFLSFASFIAAGSETEADAMAAVSLFTFPAMLLSGYIFPLSSLPKALLPVSYALPETHFVEIMRGICLRGSSAIELAPHFLYLGLAPVIWLVAGARRFHRSILES
jgi:ABC-2 type transport system permease protein